MKVKAVLKKGMSKEDVNTLVGEYIYFEDDIFLGSEYKHSWRCKCGNLFKRQWGNARYNSNFDCGCIRRNQEELKYKEEIESTDEYEYIRSFRKGDILPNGKTIRSRNQYVQIKHKYCNRIYEVQIASFARRGDRCTKCCGSYEKSFAHHVEVELGLKLEEVWDFEKNTVNPYHISKNAHLKVWIKCQNKDYNRFNKMEIKDYHGSYEVLCYTYADGQRCSYCNPTGKTPKIHLYDSFGYHNFDKVMSWHPDNDISPFRVSPRTDKKYKFICDMCNAKWESRLHHISNGRWCPVCAASKGEKRVKSWLDKNNFKSIHNEEYFKALVGIGGSPLRPDFILPDYKIWIEYDGEFHYKKMYKDDGYEILKIHDKRKDEYAKKHGWKMIRIPYWEFDNIENILEREIF